jgi:hypothetical protein
VFTSVSASVFTGLWHVNKKSEVFLIFLKYIIFNFAYLIRFHVYLLLVYKVTVVKLLRYLGCSAKIRNYSSSCSIKHVTVAVNVLQKSC